MEYTSSITEDTETEIDRTDEIEKKASVLETKPHFLLPRQVRSSE